MIRAICVDTENDSDEKLVFGQEYLIVPAGSTTDLGYERLLCEVYILGTRDQVVCNGKYGTRWFQKRFKPINLTPQIGV